MNDLSLKAKQWVTGHSPATAPSAASRSRFVTAPFSVANRDSDVIFIGEIT